MDLPGMGLPVGGYVDFFAGRVREITLHSVFRFISFLGH